VSPRAQLVAVIIEVDAGVKRHEPKQRDVALTDAPPLTGGRPLHLSPPHVVAARQIWSFYIKR